jgi:hypothetical protein
MTTPPITIIQQCGRTYTHRGKQREMLRALQSCTYLGSGKYWAATTFLASLLGITQPAACQRRKTFARQTGAVVSGQFITLPLSMIKAEVKRLRWRQGTDPKPYTQAHVPISADFLSSDAHAASTVITKLREGQQPFEPESIPVGQQGPPKLADSQQRPNSMSSVSLGVCPACARNAVLVHGAISNQHGEPVRDFWTCRSCMQTDQFTGRTHLMWSTVRQWLWKQANATAQALSTLRDSVLAAVRRVNDVDRRTVLERNGWSGDSSWKTWLASVDADALHIIELASADLPDQRTWLLAHGYGQPDRFGNVPEWAR